MSNLCCCEYIDIEGERNHLLACCCNCRDFDEGFEGLITGKGVPEQNRIGMAHTIKDRIRIPWLGGAKQISPDKSIPMVVLPLLLLLATISLEFSILAAIILIGIFVVIYKYFKDAMPKFFYVWTGTSIVVLYLIYQFLVVSFLMILLEENVALSLVLAIDIFCIYRIKAIVGALKGPILDKDTYCTICQISMPEGTHHRYWIDSCITPSNKLYYITSLILSLTALLYSSNLTLTSVCHPFKFFLTVLLPDDCSDAYQQMELSLSFVTALYSILLSVFIFWDLVFMVCCASATRGQRTYSRGFCCSAFRNLCCYINQYRIVSNQP